MANLHLGFNTFRVIYQCKKCDKVLFTYDEVILHDRCEVK
jgi:hypothetical protein